LKDDLDRIAHQTERDLYEGPTSPTAIEAKIRRALAEFGEACAKESDALRLNESIAYMNGVDDLAARIRSALGQEAKT